jgi:hypothetical protein
MVKMSIVDGKVVSSSFETTTIPSRLQPLCKNAVCVNLDTVFEKMNEERKKEIMKNNNGSVTTSLDYVELNGVRLTTEEIFSGLEYGAQTKCANKMVINNTARNKSSCVSFSNGNMTAVSSNDNTDDNTSSESESESDNVPEAEVTTANGKTSVSLTDCIFDENVCFTTIATRNGGSHSVSTVENIVARQGTAVNVICARNVINHTTTNIKKQKIIYENLKGRTFETFVDEQKNKYDIEKIIANLDEQRREMILAYSGFRFSSYQSPKKPLTITINGINITNKELQIGCTRA